ncbi:MAG TPA: phosphatase PAP2 family protein [Gaiellaceae bacterium]|jgi:membrane-associated phospholipid phosphatase|nr:phosphatase PAP2 family protein [Gaiellaceae bacterium]
MPLLVLFLLVGVVGLTVGLLVWRYPRISPRTSTPSLETAEAIGETVGKRSRLARRLDPTVATGLALTVALVIVIGGGVLLAVLAYLVRSNGHLLAIDRSVAKWGNRNATPTEMRVLNDLTHLGSIFPVVIGLCVVLAVVETVRERTVWVVAFIATVMVGEEALQLAIKDLAHRIRPAFNPAAATLGPSFPSGHSATAAAFYATAALLLGRYRPRLARAFLAGGAVAIAVMVAGTRVLLDLHWLSDVIGGLALGWAWFAVCAIAYGGRILRFGAGADKAAQAAEESNDNLARVA